MKETGGKKSAMTRCQTGVLIPRAITDLSQQAELYHAALRDKGVLSHEFKACQERRWLVVCVELLPPCTLPTLPGTQAR